MIGKCIILKIYLQKIEVVMSTDPNGSVSYAIDQYEKHRPQYAPGLFLKIIERFRLEAGDRVLDIGSGTGNTVGPMLENGKKVVALYPK